MKQYTPYIIALIISAASISGSVIYVSMQKSAVDLRLDQLNSERALFRDIRDSLEQRSEYQLDSIATFYKAALNDYKADSSDAAASIKAINKSHHEKTDLINAAGADSIISLLSELFSKLDSTGN